MWCYLCRDIRMCCKVLQCATVSISQGIMVAYAVDYTSTLWSSSFKIKKMRHDSQALKLFRLLFDIFCSTWFLHDFQYEISLGFSYCHHYVNAHMLAKLLLYMYNQPTSVLLQWKVNAIMCFWHVIIVLFMGPLFPSLRNYGPGVSTTWWVVCYESGSTVLRNFRNKIVARER